jgi:hypothetical protein
MRPEQLPMLFHTQWKSKLDKIRFATMTCDKKREFNLHKILGQLIPMSFYQNLPKSFIAGHQK